eukprot:6214688-Pleurochrysis_carterae.AAC.4
MGARLHNAHISAQINTYLNSQSICLFRFLPFWAPFLVVATRFLSSSSPRFVSACVHASFLRCFVRACASARPVVRAWTCCIARGAAVIPSGTELSEAVEHAISKLARELNISPVATQQRPSSRINPITSRLHTGSDNSNIVANRVPDPTTSAWQEQPPPSPQSPALPELSPRKGVGVSTRSAWADQPDTHVSPNTSPQPRSKPKRAQAQPDTEAEAAGADLLLQATRFPRLRCRPIWGEGGFE